MWALTKSTGRKVRKGIGGLVSETRNVNFKSWIGLTAKDHFFGISLDHHKRLRDRNLRFR